MGALQADGAAPFQLDADAVLVHPVVLGQHPAGRVADLRAHDALASYEFLLFGSVRIHEARAQRTGPGTLGARLCASEAVLQEPEEFLLGCRRSHKTRVAATARVKPLADPSAGSPPDTVREAPDACGDGRRLVVRGW
ncbi:hypothetical protein ALMP_04210 [Streptomyces sp. A012304]|nr:hypothetical protein ALMP_04210 [Streptomyces sp. A012304]